MLKKTLNPAIMLSVGLLLQSCSGPSRYPTAVASNMIHRQSVDIVSPQQFPTKSAKTVAIYGGKDSPHAPYRVIGIAKVSKYNLLGMKRQEDTMHTMIKNLAASIGGDGVIDVSQNNEDMQAKVIAFQKILI